MSPGSLQYVYRWRIGQWSTLAPCVEHNSPAFDADGLCWVFKLFKGRARNPSELALYLAVHESADEALREQRKKVDVSFTLENLRTRGLDYNKHPAPITVWVDSAFSTWGDDRFISLCDIDSFVSDDTVCLVVRFRVRETVGTNTRERPSPAIAVYVPDRISAPFNQLLKSARFSDIQFELRDSSALLLSPGPQSAKFADALGIEYALGHPTPPEVASDEDVRSPCVTPMPGNCPSRPLPYSTHARIGSEPQVPAAGPRYHAHKAILMAVSPVFEAMFSNGMRETYEKIVQVWDVTSRAFERMLEYAYTRTCDMPHTVSSDEVVETLLCADQFGVSGLQDICWRSLLQRISTETVWDIWSIATDLDARSPQKVCLAFCARSFTDLCHAQSTLWAPAHLLRQALISDSLNVQSEELLFETVVRWAEFREDVESPDMRRSVMSASRHSAGAMADEAVLTCHRSPSSLAQLLQSPRSPWTRRPRRKAELTREAYTHGNPLSPAPSSPTSPCMPMVTRLSADLTQPATAQSSSSIWSSLFARKEFLPELLPCIRFPMMDKAFLLRVVERNADLMAIPVMKDLLIEAYRFHAFNPMPSTPVVQEKRRASECFARKEQRHVQYAKIILPLNTADDLALSRSQRRKRVHVVSAQKVNFSP
ncbi:hypothetical protein IW139_003206 [Coemansia sp. RSA 353]|nr:hypothetical protein IW142_003335 [Coemansia sp. RSA 564]KAJ2185679.1 hypothetical protein EV181_003738 [Coemansia sp. RSA 532]KAJ2194973.1 hypothetical protein IW144_003688 [Coemansia sp. RSA 522]KAJ2294838.1 hypothetical protein IW141_000120 [Coemansia sp. RSA 355]KAJ2296735.1 hypothetical protein IW139_003206 [Coemansia sp. RSA 353]KAJ2407008.1 hypothetical protein J3F80_003128 [Coemansia sp. RSA 2526]